MGSLKKGALDIFDVKGASDWQIFQQKDGRADIALSGAIHMPDYEDPQLHTIIRMVREDSFCPATRNTEWRKTDSYDGKSKFEHCFCDIPCGGLYRIEIGVSSDPALQSFRMLRTIHSLGVGDLWVIAGQSNASGIGRGAVVDPPELGAHILRNDEQWALAMHPLNENTDSFHANNDEGCPQHSPYLAFAKNLKNELGWPIGLIQTSLGGSPLSRWNPAENGDLYANMIYCSKLAGGRVKGVLWYQGCSDTNFENSESYGERFKHFVDCVRKDLSDPDLPFVTTQINRAQRNDEASNPFWDKVRETQRRLAEEISNLALVPTGGLPLSDTIHNSAAGNLELAARYARTVLGMLYGRDIEWKYPNIRQITKQSSNQLLMEFDNVSSLMTSISMSTEALTVEDCEGVVLIESFQPGENGTLLLTLARDLKGPACVSSGCGCDARTSLYDFHEHRPALAFARIKVEE